MRCSGCGNEISDKSKFCKFCGVAVEKKDYHCTVCGELLKGGKGYCTNCGMSVKQKEEEHRIEVYEQEDNWVEDKQRNKISRFIVTLLLGLGVLVIATSLSFLYVKSKYEENSINREVEIEEVEEAKNQKVEKEQRDDKLDECIRGKNELYNKLELGITSNKYNPILSIDGAVGYYENQEVKVIVAAKGEGDEEYNRLYYFDQGELFLAHYKDDNDHRFYFDDGTMIRWSYSEDKESSDTATNYDGENTKEYKEWERSVLSQAKQIKEACDRSLAAGATTVGGNTDYMIEESDSRYIGKSELYRFSEEELRIARNEIYARHGRIFKDEALNEYFQQFDWYHPSITPEEFDESVLNEYELWNNETIIQIEKDQGYR